MADSFLKEFGTFDFREEVNKRARVSSSRSLDGLAEAAQGHALAADPLAPMHRAAELELDCLLYTSDAADE